MARYYRLSVAQLTEGKLIVKSSDSVKFDVTYSSVIVLPQPEDNDAKTVSGQGSVEVEIDKDAMNQHQELYIQVHSNTSCSYSMEFVTDSNMQQVLEHGVQKTISVTADSDTLIGVKVPDPVTLQLMGGSVESYYDLIVFEVQAKDALGDCELNFYSYQTYNDKKKVYGVLNSQTNFISFA